jgi:hypothetical protein
MVSYRAGSAAKIIPMLQKGKAGAQSIGIKSDVSRAQFARRPLQTQDLTISA